KTAMDAMKKHMDANQQVKLDYASSYASIANYWKNRQGMIDALTHHQTAETKRKKEEELIAMISEKREENKDDKNNKKTGGLLLVTNDDSSKDPSQKMDPSVRAFPIAMNVINDYYDKTNIKSRNANYLIGFLR